MGFNNLFSSSRPYHTTHSARVAGNGELSATFPKMSLGESTGTTLDSRVEEQLAERSRLAQELHDTLLQGFFAVSMRLHAAVDALPGECADSKSQLHDVAELLDRVLQDGRCVVQGLRSPNECNGPLGAAFAGVPKESGFLSGAGYCVIILGREKELRAGLRQEVYCIVREAIINAYRHSRARRIETEIEYGRTELRIAVRDDGCGINPQKLHWGRNEHWGLRGMRERAERIGAQLCLLSKVALGTEVELRVPSRIAFEPSGSPD
jgi:signal transduction histidine kinase